MIAIDVASPHVGMGCNIMRGMRVSSSTRISQRLSGPLASKCNRFAQDNGLFTIKPCRVPLKGRACVNSSSYHCDRVFLTPHTSVLSPEREIQRKWKDYEIFCGLELATFCRSARMEGNLPVCQCPGPRVGLRLCYIRKLPGRIMRGKGLS